MKKILFILLLLPFLSRSQTTYHMRYDTVRMYKQGASTELILENASKGNTNAFLQNYAQGRTRFAYALDSVWIDGDSIRFRYGETTLAVSAPGGSSIDTASMLSPYVYNGNEGVVKDGKYIKLGGPLGTPSQLLSNRHIDLNSNVLYFTKGDFTPDLTAFDERYTPLYTHLIDTVSSNDPAYSSTIPKSGGNWTREIRFASGAYKANNRYGFRWGMHYRAGDSIVIRTDGGDYGGSIVETRFSPAPGKTGRSVIRIGNGTGADQRRNEGVASLVGNMFVEGTDGTKYVYIRGHWVGFRPYLVMANGATDTLENVIYYSASSFVTSPSWVKKSYLIAPDVYANRADSAFPIFDTTTITSSGKAVRSYIASKMMLGKSALGTWSLPHTLAVNGGSLFTDTANYHTNIAARYTDRSLVDKNYVDSSIAAGGAWGSITGTLSDQTDLQSALDGKVDKLVSSGSNYAAISPNATGNPYIDLNTSNGSTESVLRVGNFSTGESEISLSADSLKLDFNSNENIVDISDSADYYFLVKEKGTGAKKLAVAHWPAGGGGSTDTTSLSSRIDRKFTLNLMTANNTTIGDAETRYFWSQNFGWHASNSAFAMTIAKAATIETINIEMYCGSTVGTNEDWTMTLRNNTTATETAIATVGAASANRTWTNTAMNVDVAAGDKLIIKSVTPTFATNPAGCYVHGYVIFK